MKKTIKKILPSFALDIFKSLKSPWRGDYSTWTDALKVCEGYSSEEILKKVSEATSQVASGLYPYERDSVLFDKVDYSWPLVSALLYTHHQDGYLNLVDFGGSLGSSFYQNNYFLEDLPGVKWMVVEQTNFVAEGKMKFETERLKFHSDLGAAVKQDQVNFVLFSGVLQYLENPEEIIEEVLKLSPKVIFLDRLTVIEGERDILTVQKVPKEIYNASYPCRFFSKNKIFKVFSKKYNLVAQFDSYISNTGLLNSKVAFKDIGCYWMKK